MRFVLLSTAAATVLVTGATGRTGSLVYKDLQAQGQTVRALVRNLTKAASVLGCDPCDEAHGIFQGDVTDPASLTKAFAGVDAVAIVSGSVPHCVGTFPAVNCSFPPGQGPSEVDYHGNVNQIKALLQQNPRKQGESLPLVTLVSSMGTTNQNGPSFMEEALFFKLNAEAWLMSSGAPFGIIKPCGLGGTDGAAETLLVGHDDSLSPTHPVQRANVARVLTHLIVGGPTRAVRVDLCAKDGPATTDLDALVEEAAWPWQRAPSVTILA